MSFYKSLNAANTASFAASGSTVAVGVIFWPDTTNANDSWTDEGNIEWIAETSTGDNNGGGSNTDSAMMLAQGLAAGAALLAVISF